MRYGTVFTYTEPLSSAITEQLPFLPYLLLLQMLQTHSLQSVDGEEDPRETILSEGILDQVLATLSTFGHHQPRARGGTSDREESRLTMFVCMYVYVRVVAFYFLVWL